MACHPTVLSLYTVYRGSGAYQISLAARAGFVALLPGLAMTDLNNAAEQNTRRLSGSEQRQKQCRVTFRMTQGEYEAVAEAAMDSGMTMGTFIRNRALGVAQTRPRRRPSVELETIARLQAEMNRVGSNIHQILKRVNFGETPLADEFRAALAGYREVIACILAVLGRKGAT